MDITAVAATIYLFLTAGVVAFQFALALGVPWGSYAMGGTFPGRFPPPMRVAAVGQAALLGFMAAVVMSRAGLLLSDWAQVSVWLIWVIVAFSAVSVVLNTITPSAGERRIWVPMAIVLFTSSLTVALTAG
jgi:hypothetical protein